MLHTQKPSKALQEDTRGTAGMLVVLEDFYGEQGPAGQMALPIQPIQGGTTQRTLLNIWTSSKGLRKSRTLHGGAQSFRGSVTQARHHQARPSHFMWKHMRSPLEQ